jgi:hypothetical protein
MARPTHADELFVHQVPELLPNVQTPSPHWRESYFFDVHSPDGRGDSVFFTMALFPSRQYMDSIQMGCVGGVPLISVLQRSTGDDPHTTDVGGARVDIVRPFEEIRLYADAERASIGLDLTFRSRTRPYGLRRGTLRALDEVVWDQSHILQSGSYHGTYTVNNVVHEVDGWIGQRDHSWGVRDHGRCRLWLWFQIQFEDGFLGIWHWEYENGAMVFSDGCWAGADRSEPVPVVDFRHDVDWIGAGRTPAAYGERGEDVTGLRGSCTFTLADGRSILVDADGTFDRPYEPFHRGGLNQMRVRADDGRDGTAIYEVTGARHHHFFPDAIVTGALPS